MNIHEYLHNTHDRKQLLFITNFHYFDFIDRLNVLKFTNYPSIYKLNDNDSRILEITMFTVS